MTGQSRKSPEQTGHGPGRSVLRSDSGHRRGSGRESCGRSRDSYEETKWPWRLLSVPALGHSSRALGNLLAAGAVDGPHGAESSEARGRTGVSGHRGSLASDFMTA